MVIDINGCLVAGLLYEGFHGFWCSFGDYFFGSMEVAELARKYGKGIESIMFVGDGYEDLISGFTSHQWGI